VTDEKRAGSGGGVLPKLHDIVYAKPPRGVTDIVRSIV
jgi:hypothetical protein